MECPVVEQSEQASLVHGEQQLALRWYRTTVAPKDIAFLRSRALEAVKGPVVLSRHRESTSWKMPSLDVAGSQEMGITGRFNQDKEIPSPV